MDAFLRRVEKAKRASTAQLLFKCARLLNAQAVATLPPREGPQPRTAHMALFPHIPFEGGVRLTALAQAVGISKQAVSQLLDELEAMGLVSRNTDPQDGRAKRVRFTEEGRDAILEGLAHLKEIEKQLGRAIGRARMQALHDSLLALHDHLA